MSVDKIIAGSGITIQSTGPDGTGDVLVATDGDMSVTNLKPSYQPTILNDINSASQLVFIGDSITWGFSGSSSTGFVQAPYRWSTQLSENYGKTEVNLAVPGHRWQDQLSNFYNKYTISNKPSFNGASPSVYFMACGINDVGSSPPTLYDQIVTNATATIMYATLPSSKIKLLKIGSPDVTTTGLWKNNPLFENFGMCCLSDGKKNTTGTLETTVNGRYIVINTMCLYSDLNNWIIYIDDEKVDITRQIKLLSGESFPGDFKCWIYDTGSAGSGLDHKVKLSAEISIYSAIFVDFIAGFEENQINTTPVFVAPVYNIVNFGIAALPYRSALNLSMKQMCRMLRNVYKLPVYYMEDTMDTYNTYGNITSIYLPGNVPMDGVHPGPTGHTWIKDRIVNFLENGEYVYRNTM